MSHRKLLQQAIGVILAMLFLAACGSPAATRVSQAPAAIPTSVPPTATPTPVPPTPSPPPGPQAGHWEGEPSVSFDVTTDGKIRDFRLVISIGADTCTVTVDEEIAIEADDTLITGKINSKGELEGNSISARFDSPTTMTGAYSKNWLCGGQITFFAEEGTWSAEWKSPEDAATAATAEATPTTAPVVEATPVASDVLLFDDFSSNVNGWWVGTDSSDTSDKTNQFVDGKYRMSVTARQSTMRWDSLHGFPFQDFLFSVNATVVEKTGGSPGDVSLALYFRRTEEKDYYRARFYDDDSYRIGLKKGEEWITLAEGSAEINLEPGVTNSFAILAQGEEFTFYVNGQEVTTVTDPNLSEAGWIGLGVGLADGDQAATVDFDNFLVEQAP
jgi:hypothetical protein